MSDANAPVPPPTGTPADRPSVARMYDYFLGGYHNFAIDRQAAEQIVALYPDTPLVMQANRAFLRRAVQFLVAQGIDQFLDLGSGIPTAGNVHEIAQGLNPAARVVYVDIDPVAVAHSRAILRDNPHAAALLADARQPGAILAHPETRRLLDPGRPLAVLLVALLHFVPDDDQALGLVRELRDALAPGSYLAVSHASYEGMPRELIEQGERLYARTPTPVRSRSRAQIAEFFAGLDPVTDGPTTGHLPLVDVLAIRRAGAGEETLPRAGLALDKERLVAMPRHPTAQTDIG